MNDAPFTAGGTPIDRAGGLLRLRALARELVGKEWWMRILDTGSAFRLVIEVYPAGTDRDDIEDGLADREADVELRSVVVSRSNAVRDDQLDLLVGDKLVLNELLRAEVDRLFPELEKRALGGDR